ELEAAVAGGEPLPLAERLAGRQDAAASRRAGARQHAAEHVVIALEAAAAGDGALGPAQRVVLHHRVHDGVARLDVLQPEAVGDLVGGGPGDVAQVVAVGGQGGGEGEGDVALVPVA